MNRAKHGNRRVDADGEKFDSKRELARWGELKMLERAGQISGLLRQVKFDLVPAVILDGRKKPALRYVADFEYIQDGVRVVEDAKSPHLRKDPVYRIKKHLMKWHHGIEVVEV